VDAVNEVRYHCAVDFNQPYIGTLFNRTDVLHLQLFRNAGGKPALHGSTGTKRRENNRGIFAFSQGIAQIIGIFIRKTFHAFTIIRIVNVSLADSLHDLCFHHAGTVRIPRVGGLFLIGNYVASILQTDTPYIQSFLIENPMQHFDILMQRR